MGTKIIPAAATVLSMVLASICIPGWAETQPPRIIGRDKLVVTTAPHSRQKEALRADEPELISMGTFTCYAYCSCPRCCGQWSGGPTKSATMPEEGRTVAADWSILPSGTEVYIDGVGWRTVEDTGSGITGDKLDIYMESHESALAWGAREMEVFIKPRTKYVASAKCSASGWWRRRRRRACA